jgi:hypothetical protein
MLRELPSVFHAIGNASRKTPGCNYHSTDILSLTGQTSLRAKRSNPEASEVNPELCPVFFLDWLATPNPAGFVVALPDLIIRIPLGMHRSVKTTWSLCITCGLLQMTWKQSLLRT